MQATDYQNISQYLKESRESLRVSIEEAASHLHIRVKYIRALEEGNLEEIPGKAYIRGYIRNYAQYLRLNVDEVLKAYGLLLGPKSHELYIPEPSSQQNMPTRWILWLCLAALAVIYGCWYVYYHDRSELRSLIAVLPAEFAHLLDKPLPGMVDKAWEGCLQGDDAGCYVTVQARILPTHSIYYELHRLGQLSEKTDVPALTSEGYEHADPTQKQP